MKTLKFKTSIKCEGCVESITPALNAIKGIVMWQVDLDNADRTLEVTTDTATENDIMEAVKKNGFKIERIY